MVAAFGQRDDNIHIVALYLSNKVGGIQLLDCVQNLGGVTDSGHEEDAHPQQAGAGMFLKMVVQMRR